jgi:hypothetical protein
MNPRVNEQGQDERHEIKFATYAANLPAVRGWLRLHGAGFVAPYPPRHVNNVYFDTWDYRAYADNLAGVSQRAKLRLRWYGDSPLPGTGALEVKLKRNHFGWKLRYPISAADWSPDFGWAELRSRIRAQLPADGRLWFDQNPQPVLLNRYWREYFVTADGRIRATIDTGQQAFDQRYARLPNVRSPAIMQDTLVLELKFARADRHRAVALLAAAPLRVGRHSKFMNGMRAVGMAG